MAGVGRYMRADSAYPYWCAYWNDLDGQRRERKFSVRTYGERRARQLARTERVNQLQLLGFSVDSTGGVLPPTSATRRSQHKPKRASTT